MQHPPTQVESNLTSMIDVFFADRLLVWFLKWQPKRALDLPEVPDAAAAVAGRNLGCGQRAVRCRTAWHWSSPWCWGNLSPSMLTAARRWPKRVALDLSSSLIWPSICVQTVRFILNDSAHFDALRTASARVDGGEAKVHLVLLSRPPDGFSLKRTKRCPVAVTKHGGTTSK